MAGFRRLADGNKVNRPISVNDGTLARTSTPKPGPIGVGKSEGAAFIEISQRTESEMRRHPHLRSVGNIDIGGNPVRSLYRGQTWSIERYQNAVVAQIEILQNSDTGRIVLSHVSRRLLIVPFQDPNVDSYNALARPMDRTDFSYLFGNIPMSSDQQSRNATMYGQWLDPLHPERGVGTGRGTDVVIEYTPGMWEPGNEISARNVSPTLAQEQLLHETVHAIREMEGIADTRQTFGRLQNFDARDEFHAILITNIYRSEKAIAPLRLDHHGWQPLPDPTNFYAQTHNKLMVMDLCREMPTLTQQLAKLTCPFNPLREYYAEMRAGGAGQPGNRL